MLSQEHMCYVTMTLLVIIIGMLGYILYKQSKKEGYATGKQAMDAEVAFCKQFGGLNEKDPKKICSARNSAGRCYLSALHNRCEPVPPKGMVVPQQVRQR